MSSAYDDFDIDELLAKLTPEDIEALENEVDPDNTLMPASERCVKQTDKVETGPYDRKKLMTWLEEKAKAEPDWEGVKDFNKEKKGKVFVPKEQAPITLRDVIGNDADDLPVETEFDDVLGDATEEELVDLAAALGFHSILNQEQYNASMENRQVAGGFAGMAKAESYAPVPDLPANSTDVDECIERLKDNEALLTSVNLNNIKNTSHEKMCRLFDALKENTKLKSLALANTAMKEKTAKMLAEALTKNTTVTTVNLDSNFIGCEGIVAIIRAVNVNKSVVELTLQNQRPAVLGVKSEMEIAKEVETNATLEKLGLHFDSLNARIRVQDHVQKNYDRRRKARASAQ